MGNYRKAEELEKMYDEQLKPFATKHCEFKTLREDIHNEETGRTRFRRDRDRILYSKGFRRLQNKTQVVLSNLGDDFRTRLTHTLEVEQIATSICDALSLNRDLASAIAMGHDVGHTPFGHAVEELFKEKDVVFAHSVQSVRYLDRLANNYSGMVLSQQVLEGILKHDSDLFKNKSDYFQDQLDISEYYPEVPPTLEAQVVFWADKIAYLSHDFEDFTISGLREKALKQGIIQQEELNTIQDLLILDCSCFETRDIIRNVIKNLVEGSSDNLELLKPTSAQNATEITKNRFEAKKKGGINDKKAYRESLLINFKEDFSKGYELLNDLKQRAYIESPEVKSMDAKAKRIIGPIFDVFMGDEKLLPWATQNHMMESGISKRRVIVDHIAGMTDRYAKLIYSNLFELGGDFNRY